MRLPTFKYLAPETIRDALTLLDHHKKEIKILAGGTEAIPLMKLGLEHPAYIMAIRNLKLAGIKEGKRELIIGAATPLRELKDCLRVHEVFRGLFEAVEAVAVPSIQNTGTLGGNLLQDTRCLYRNQSAFFRDGHTLCFKTGGTECHAVKGGTHCFSVYQGDLAPVLISLGATVELRSKGGSRVIPVSELFKGNGRVPIGLSANEILTKVRIKHPKRLYASTYEKLRMRGSLEYPLACAAVFLSSRKKGFIEEARIVIGASGPSPKIIDTSEILKGKWPGDEIIERISVLASRNMEVADNISAPSSYRRKMAGICAKRALKRALVSLQGGE